MSVRPPHPTGYWDRYQGRLSVTPSGLKDKWGRFMDEITDNHRHVVIRRSRISGRRPPSTAAVAVPHSWWLRQVRKYGEPSRTDEVRVSHFRSASATALGMSRYLDQVQDKGVHLSLIRLRDVVATLVPADWYAEITGKDVS